MHDSITERVTDSGWHLIGFIDAWDCDTMVVQAAGGVKDDDGYTVHAALPTLIVRYVARSNPDGTRNIPGWKWSGETLPGCPDLPGFYLGAPDKGRVMDVLAEWADTIWQATRRHS